MEHMPIQEGSNILNSLEVLTAETLVGGDEMRAASALAINSKFDSVHVENKLHIEGDLTLKTPLKRYAQMISSMLTPTNSTLLYKSQARLSRLTWMPYILKVLMDSSFRFGSFQSCI